MENRKIRLHYIDKEIAEGVLGSRHLRIAETLKMLQDEPGRLVQTRQSSLENNYILMATESYALGYPIAYVREAFENALNAWTKVFELRGTEAPFPVSIVRFDPNDPSKRQERPLHSEGSKDYSVGNSGSGYLAVCLSLMLGKVDHAERLAGTIFDPSDASYIGPDSTCNWNDHHLAYALRFVYEGDTEGAIVRLKKVHKAKWDERNTVDQALMVLGLATEKGAMFLDGLKKYLAWHEKIALRKDKRTDTNFFICIRGLGLAVLALQRKLITPGDLPKDNPFFPLELAGIV